MRPLLAGVGIGVLLVVAACDGGGTATKPTQQPPDVRPITDEPPYLCDLVPERSFRRMTGLDIEMSPRWSAGPQKWKPKNDLDQCLAFAEGRKAPLGIGWSSRDDPDEQIRDRRDVYSSWRIHDLPSELGKGFIARLTKKESPVLPDRPNWMVSAFSCGNERFWMSIDTEQVVEGRDEIQDLTDLMRIAQRRFGELNKCTVRPT